MGKLFLSKEAEIFMYVCMYVCVCVCVCKISLSVKLHKTLGTLVTSKEGNWVLG